ncbi:hypothetical protein D3C78_748440 [compost metagenome]
MLGGQLEATTYFLDGTRHVLRETTTDAQEELQSTELDLFDLLVVAGLEDRDGLLHHIDVLADVLQAVTSQEETFHRSGDVAFQTGAVLLQVRQDGVLVQAMVFSGLHGRVGARGTVTQADGIDDAASVRQRLQRHVVAGQGFFHLAEGVDVTFYLSDFVVGLGNGNDAVDGLFAHQLFDGGVGLLRLHGDLQGLLQDGVGLTHCRDSLISRLS